MNKGFTLAELLGVIAIIGIIATIVTVTVDKNIKNSRYNTCLMQEESIKEAAKTWSIDNPSQLNNLVENNALIEVTISELKKDGYLEDIKSPMTNKDFSNDTKVIISLKDNTKNYIYEVKYNNEKEKCVK